MKGKLFLIPSPIGNMEDITLRAIRILREVDVIFCENIKRGLKLLNRYEIKKKLFAHHQNNEKAGVKGVIKWLDEGKKVAFLTEAGTPGISDPGYLLVNACIAQDIETECLPGPTALIPALVNSGLPSNEFLFVGFLPQKKGRKKKLQNLSTKESTLIFYESPHRLVKFLGECLLYFEKDRRISVSKEISKIYEQTFRSTLEEMYLRFKDEKIKGEFVVCMEGKKKGE